MIRQALLYIATAVFILGLLILLATTSTEKPSIGWLVVGSYCIVSAIVCSVLVTVVEPRLRPLRPVEENTALVQTT